MALYEVAVSSSKYRGTQTLTYSSENTLKAGSIVTVPIRSSSCLGIVIRVAKPIDKIRPKPIEAQHNLVLPAPQFELLLWLCQYYPAPISTIASLFLPPAVESPSSVANTSTAHPQPLPKLTTEQVLAIKTISESSGPVLLHGDTGTGKTRVYIELAQQALDAGKSSIILVPEIGLTPQMVKAFNQQFPDRVLSVHSGMTPKQRRQIWRQIYDNPKPQVVIGPRSALFMPVANLGLVVIDESHDSGYKQDQLPYYDATRVSAKLSALTGAKCVYGTATPRLADYWHLSQHSTPIVRMSKPIDPSIKPPTSMVIDASNRDQFSRSGVFSEPALSAMSDTLSKKQQVLVFLNRRGTARLVSCSQCGWIANCPNCDTPLTYHGDKHDLRCHTCGITTAVPTSCPDCQSADLKYQRRGTKALQTELEKLFPEANIARFDSDNTKAEQLSSQFKAVSEGKVDIILGTQVITKGLDLGNLSLVVVPQADLSTYLPDFTADEQTFQLLRQVIGRVGRTNKPSQVIVQTYHPDSPIIQSALSNNWSEFYEQQLVHRKKYNFPPYCYLLQLSISRATPTSARKKAQELKTQLEDNFRSLEILGPAPRFHEKIQGKYQWQLVIKSSDRNSLLKIIASLPSGWRYDIDPTNLL